MAAKKIVTGSVVRKWAADPANLAKIAGLPEGFTIGSRGRLPFEVAEAFEKATGQRYVPGTKEVKKVSVTVVAVANGHKIPLTKKVVLSEVREYARFVGHKVGTRGRIIPAYIEEFVVSTSKVTAAASA